jgi:DNA-binding transcriptional ArsR family regulator
MDTSTASRALAALASEPRIAAFRLLVQAEPDGLPAGEIARALGMRHNTLSTHLGTLGHAGLVHSRRDGRSVIYRADLGGLRSLLAFLLEDCCGGAPDACASALDALIPACCGEPEGADAPGATP